MITPRPSVTDTLPPVRETEQGELALRHQLAEHAEAERLNSIDAVLADRPSLMDKLGAKTVSMGSERFSRPPSAPSFGADDERLQILPKSAETASCALLRSFWRIFGEAEFRVSVQAVARAGSISNGYARKVIRDLEAGGYLVVQPPPDGEDPRGARRYKLTGKLT